MIFEPVPMSILQRKSEKYENDQKQKHTSIIEIKEMVSSVCSKSSSSCRSSSSISYIEKWLKIVKSYSRSYIID